MTIDKILFILDNDITDETILAVLSAVQSYVSAAYNKVIGWNSIHGDKRQLSLNVYIAYENVQHYFLFDRCVQHLVGIKATMQEFDSEIVFDSVIKLSLANAFKVAAATNRHLSDAFGVISGGETKSLPDVSNLYTSYVLDTDVMVDADLSLCRQGIDVLNDVLGPVAKILIFSGSNSSYNLAARAACVFAAKAVIGYSSFETYLASALQKPVFEIQFNKHLYKWSNKKYVCVTSEENQDAINKGIKLCLEQVCVGSTQTVQETSSVEVAVTL